jgi:NAD(P)-dependent dehydrogenase (short-subunit alcohol dehydrogenase family)
MNQTFAGRKLLVVGGTSGMGYQTARQVLSQGGSAVIVGRRAEKTAQAQKELSVFGHEPGA